MREELTIDEIFELAAAKGIRPKAWQWKELPNYGGYDHKQRVRKWQACHLAIQLGLISPASDSACEICGTTSSQTKISFHSEKYVSMEVYALCLRCHSRLHRRFFDQNSWREIIKSYGDGTKWFESLKTMHPSVQER